MSKHTPGPWRVEVHQATTTIESKHFTIASDVCNDDAPLIAAAPELLEALKQVLAHHGYIEGGPDFSDAWKAIAKAEGREP